MGGGLVVVLCCVLDSCCRKELSTKKETNSYLLPFTGTLSGYIQAIFSFYRLIFSLFILFILVLKLLNVENKTLFYFSFCI
jgi:hypothetical protein